MKDSKDREILELRKQFQAAYGVKHKLERYPEFGEFEILPMSSGDDLGNLQRMVEIDLDRGLESLLKEMNFEGEADEFKKQTGMNLVSARLVAEQRNRVLRAQVIPPEKLKPVWDWVPKKDGDVDPMLDVIPKPVLNELFLAVSRVTAGSYQLTESGDPTAEAAAKK